MKELTSKDDIDKEANYTMGTKLEMKILLEDSSDKDFLKDLEDDARKASEIVVLNEKGYKVKAYVYNYKYKNAEGKNITSEKVVYFYDDSVYLIA